MSGGAGLAECREDLVLIKLIIKPKSVTKKKIRLDIYQELSSGLPNTWTSSVAYDNR